VPARNRKANKAQTSATGERPSLTQRFAAVKLFLCDVDGVLTDGTVLLGEGKEYKTFSIQDGLGLLLLKKHGLRVGWISARPSAVTQQRGEELRIEFIYQVKGSKVTTVEELLAATGFQWNDVCYMGDDVVDLGVLRRVGAAVAVANAIADVKHIAHYVTSARGGHGAVREVVELILRAQNKWKDVIAQHMQ
jgi:3-deoxy-D-manno-octulosonate 8-phosphate phosphatase (KDO 8-P phosphatase)